MAWKCRSGAGYVCEYFWSNQNKSNTTVLPYANIILKTAKDSAFVTGTVSNEEGRFTLTNVKPNDYILTVSLVGFNVAKQKIFVGKLSAFLDLPVIELSENVQTLGEITVQGKADEVSAKMDKKVFSIANNISQSGGRFCRLCKAYQV
jgi:hypothetical protein